jgi:cytochrome oxidase assembly protein ShyY1
LLRRSKNEHTLAAWKQFAAAAVTQLNAAAAGPPPRRIVMLTIKNSYAVMMFTWLALAAAVMFLALARALSQISLTLT